MPSNSPADLLPRNLRALHGALEHSVTIQATRLQDLMDDLVVRGSLTRAEADELLGQLVTASKAYSQALLQVLDTVTEHAGPVTATAGRVAQGVAQTVSQTVSQTVGQALAQVPRRRPAGAGATDDAADPDLAGLTVAQARTRLTGLDTATLRRLRAQEAAGRNRKGVLAEIDRRLGQASVPAGTKPSSVSSGTTSSASTSAATATSAANPASTSSCPLAQSRTSAAIRPATAR